MLHLHVMVELVVQEHHHLSAHLTPNKTYESSAIYLLFFIDIDIDASSLVVCCRYPNNVLGGKNGQGGINKRLSIRHVLNKHFKWNEEE